MVAAQLQLQFQFRATAVEDRLRAARVRARKGDRQEQEREKGERGRERREKEFQILMPEDDTAGLGPASDTATDVQAVKKSVRGVDRGWHYSFCGGRIVLGPDYKAMIASCFLIIAPLAVFYALVIPYTVAHMSPAYLAFSVVLTLVPFCTLVMTATRDPGFIPRSSPGGSGWSPHKQTHEFRLENGYAITTKFCATCCHYRPPRCAHCSACDNCVDKFDHHCPWVGNCIGRRNYPTFFAFVSSTTVLCIWVIIVSLLQLNDSAVDQHGGDWGPTIQAYPGSLAVTIYAFLASWFVGGLTVFHSYLITKNTSTYEHFRNKYSSIRRENPYDRGFFGNWKEALFSKTPERCVDGLWEDQMNAMERGEAGSSGSSGSSAAGDDTYGEADTHL